MSARNNAPQQPPMGVLNALELGVQSAENTHRFLCDVFSRPDFEAPSRISPDGKKATFLLYNTCIEFITAVSSKPSSGDHTVSINLLVQDVENVKKVLDQHKHWYKLGQWKELPGKPKWIQFKDLDGYTWIVGEFPKE